MAQTVKKTTPVEEVTTETVAAKKPKKYAATDVIPCVSITAGELGMVGIKSHINYRWVDRGDVVEVEYQDLTAAIRSKASYITKPYFIIQDDDFVEQFPVVKKAYASLYSIRDLHDVLNMTPAKMKSTILSLPDGAKDSIKNLAASQIMSGQLDSVKKIKILDEIYGTEMILMTGLFK